uniref:Hemerythrin-like domain-containing protein n=1 Tax=Cladonia uncialis subsp. uncialis TaxID=180999 RepID=A0A1Z1CEA6_CLAUC|nr:hypothetical protein [Cladonia uncialis subsp. uncialis]AUW30808.1 hypothetical protein [Cladonia uncialis subsp. uncialis]
MDASHMALVHNVFIRGYNSIYQQAPHIRPADYRDFVGYCLAWHEMVQGHHDSEEEVLFPGIEEATGVKGIMDGEKAEHASLHAGLSSLATYLRACTAQPGSFESSALLAIMDTLAPALATHLANEPPALASLATYAIDMKDLSDKTAKHSMARTSVVNLLPMLWFNLDVDFEDGKWNNFPPISGPVRWVLTWLLVGLPDNGVLAGSSNSLQSGAVQGTSTPSCWGIVSTLIQHIDQLLRLTTMKSAPTSTH